MIPNRAILSQPCWQLATALLGCFGDKRCLRQSPTGGETIA